MQKFPEIIAPAGNSEMMKAAVENGADAVYFGLSKYNARMRAENFNENNLPDIMSNLHIRGVKGYVTLNTLFFPDETDDAIRYFQICSDSGVDAVMVQDLGIAYIIGKVFPDLQLYASTQMSLTSAESIKAAKKLGLNLKRVVIARELNSDELKMVKQESNTEIEVFIHGALCISYSGQCLASETFGGRSANRGMCAQSCRLPYQIIADGKIYENPEIKFPISPKDLCLYNDLEELIKIGIEGLKIEGRLKTNIYVAGAVRAYRNKIDSILKNKNNVGNDSSNNKDDLIKLEQIFSRGMTKGYFPGINHQGVVEGRYSKKRGILAGQVFNSDKSGIYIKPEDVLKTGDGIVFDVRETFAEEIGGRIYEIFDGKRKINIIEKKDMHKVYKLTFAEGKIDFSKIKKGDWIWKTGDQKLDSELASTYSGDRIKYKRPVKAGFKASVGKKAVLTLRDWDDNCVEVLDSIPAEKAIKQPMTKETLISYIGRLGETPFYLEEFNCELDGDIMIPFSRLNDLRRDAVNKLIDARKSIGKNRSVNENFIEQINTEIESYITKTKKNKVQKELAVLCRNIHQVETACCFDSVKRIYTDFNDVNLNSRAAAMIKEKNKQFFVSTIRVLKPGEENFIQDILKFNPDGILVRNLASYNIIKRINPDISLIADYSLNTANHYTAFLLMKNDFKKVSPAIELNCFQILNLLGKSAPDWFEIVIYNYNPMFYMQHCLFCRFLTEAENNKSCGMKCRKTNLKLADRKGFSHTVKTDPACRNIVYSSTPQTAVDYINNFISMGIGSFRLEFLDEDKETSKKIINIFSLILNKTIPENLAFKDLNRINKNINHGTFDLE